jgi:hypothetical protein
MEEARIYFLEFTYKGATSPLRKSSRDGAQKPLCSSPRARPTLKPKITYYEILREDGEYKLLVELTIRLSTHKHI